MINFIGPKQPKSFNPNQSVRRAYSYELDKKGVERLELELLKKLNPHGGNTRLFNFRFNIAGDNLLLDH